MRARLLPLLVLSLLLSALLSACTIWKEQTPPTWKSATGAEDFERLFWQAVKAKDWTQVERRLAATFVAVDREGTHDREATMARLRQLDLEDYSIGEVEVRPNGADMTVTYTMAMRGNYKGKPLPAGPFRMLTVWQQAKDGWIAIAHSDIPATNGQQALPKM